MEPKQKATKANSAAIGGGLGGAAAVLLNAGAGLDLGTTEMTALVVVMTAAVSWLAAYFPANQSA